MLAHLGQLVSRELQLPLVSGLPVPAAPSPPATAATTPALRELLLQEPKWPRDSAAGGRSWLPPAPCGTALPAAGPSPPPGASRQAPASSFSCSSPASSSSCTACCPPSSRTGILTFQGLEPHRQLLGLQGRVTRRRALPLSLASRSRSGRSVAPAAFQDIGWAGMSWSLLRGVMGGLELLSQGLQQGPSCRRPSSNLLLLCSPQLQGLQARVQLHHGVLAWPG